MIILLNKQKCVFITKKTIFIIFILNLFQIKYNLHNV
jgi:hypothetical protein